MTPEIILDSYNYSYDKDRPLQIIETGCVSTIGIARWVSNHDECKFESIDLDARLQKATHTELECAGLSKFCIFHTQDPIKFLSKTTWIDIAFLSPYGLQEGQEQFCMVVSSGASMIVTYDYQARGALAVRKAHQLGWLIEHLGKYSVLKRRT